MLKSTPKRTELGIIFFFFTLKIFQITQIFIVYFVEECRYSFDQMKNKFV